MNFGQAGRTSFAEEPTRLIRILSSAVGQPAGVAAPPFQADAFNMVGVFDVDWLLDPRFTRLLDNLAASPGAFGAVRFFGAFNSGEKENVFPTSSGDVWRYPSEPIDFSVTMRALDTLVSRQLVPFISLTFFPAAVSPSPVQPPSSFDNWQRLVRAFLDRSIEHFGAAEVGRWWLEVWNEPNMPPFWAGSFERYLDLYRATSEAVQRSGHAVRMGGPAIAYVPGQGPGLITRFLRFLHREPEVKCDFISMHRKGIWTSEESWPNLHRSIEAAEETARAALQIDPARFRNTWIVNNEADMKVGFDTPFEPRMTEQFPSWLAAQAIAYDGLTTRHVQSGLRFSAASDDANQQLIRAPFDGRRSIMTRLGRSDDLAKVPAYNFYEMLRLLGETRGTIQTPAAIYPNSDLYHLITSTAHGISSLFTLYPSEQSAIAGQQRVEYLLRAIPWKRINIAEFRIDAAFSNSFTAAGGVMQPPDIDPAAARRIRRAQELMVSAPIQRDQEIAGELRSAFDLPVFSTVLQWITPFSSAVPTAPQWLGVGTEQGNVILRWTPNREPWFYSYEVFRVSLDGASVLITPVPLRAAFWVDTAVPAGEYRYSLRAVSASGIRSETVASQRVRI